MTHTIWPGPFDVVKRAVTGLRQVEIPAGYWVPSKTNGCTAANSFEIGAANKKTIIALTFAVASDSYAECEVTFPDGWDRGTVTFKAYGYSVVAEDAADVITFALAGLSRGHNEDVDTAFGTAQTSIITVAASPSVTKELIGAKSSAITFGGTPASGDTVMLRLMRDVATAGTDGSQSFYLTKILIQYNVQDVNETRWS